MVVKVVDQELVELQQQILVVAVVVHIIQVILVVQVVQV